MDSKVGSLEQGVALLNAEQRRERENFGRLEVTSLKSNEEFRNMLNQLQNETQYKLEVKMTDLVNRLLTEADERSRSIEDVKYQIDMKDKLIKE